MTAIKSMTGHTSGGSGLLSLVVALEALAPGGSRRPSGCASRSAEAAAFRFVRGRRPATADLRLAQVDAFGFGGVNAVAMVERAGGARWAAGAAADPVVVTGVGLALPGVDATGRPAAPGSVAGRRRRSTRAALLGRRGLRYKDRATQLALCAAAGRAGDAGLLAAGTWRCPASRSGWWPATNSATSTPSARSPTTIAETAPSGISPMGLPNASSNVIASSVAIRYGLRGPNLTLCNGATSGLDAVHWAAASLIAARPGRARAGGRRRAPREPAGRRPPARTARSRPAARRRRGAVVLERAEAAAARGGEVRALARRRTAGTRRGVAACARARGCGRHRPGAW